MLEIILRGIIYLEYKGADEFGLKNVAERNPVEEPK